NVVINLCQTCKQPPIYNQGKLGSCTANAICAAYYFDELNNNGTIIDQTFEPSRLYLYYQERKLENDVEDDNGAIIADGLKVLNEIGVCSEENWPYDITKFTESPTKECDEEAQKNKSIDQRRVKQTLEDIKQCLINKLP